MAGHAANRKSITYSVRVPLWLDEQIEKLLAPEESKSNLVVMALIAYVVGDDDG